MKQGVLWRRNLYENCGLPDNYTDDTFLEQLRKNIKSNNVTLLEAITLGANISIQLSIVTIFVLIFIWLNKEWTTPNIIFILGAILTVIGYIVYSFKVSYTCKRLIEDLRTVLVFLMFGYILSPILKTLTETISTDTIYAMTILMFLTHLIFNKYGSSLTSLSDSLSTTSSIFGSLMLASRLTSPLHAFSLLTVSVQCFVLLPFLLSKLNKKIVISMVLTFVTVYSLLFISQNLSYVFVMATMFVHFICPFWYVKGQQYKNNIYGPWDEAIITS